MNKFLPYGRHVIDEDDIASVVEVLRSDWLTTGPKVGELEKAVASYCGARHGVAVSSGTAALHAAMHALGIGPGDEVIVPAITFVATANCVVYQGGTPVFADVEPDTLLIDPADVERKITGKTKAIIAVDYAGQPCNYDTLREIANKHGLNLVADACHSLGASYKRRKVGTLADLTVFSFHPVKHITTGEGGMIVTDGEELAARMRRFRNHGIATDHRQREAQRTWRYEMVDLGFNYRISDFQCALGMSQLRKLAGFVERRQEIAFRYNQKLANLDEVKRLLVSENVTHAYHLYVVRLRNNHIRTSMFKELRDRNIGVNVHYVPVYLHPFYRNCFGTGSGQCQVAEEQYSRIISLPIYPALTDEEVARVVEELRLSLTKIGGSENNNEGKSWS
ncbi:MAG: UDP-4-amino-4,6-dideoxy-N-acetyl-beta-L-altrosamine transaminase [Desulfobacteraceae bacterium]|nr:UDP-4-amino-4,6-dideoxy-N-acetyl-beta-L-altrosamine transaminase [Desulfobacteraceae bacterium]